MPKHRILSNVGWILLITVLLALSVPYAYAQNTSATLTGTVTDASSAIVPKAAVSLKNEASGDIRRTVSNGEGFFTFASIPPATYSITITMQGFSTWEMSGVVLNSGDKRNLSNISLKPGTTKEVVTIEATAEQITPVDSGEKSTVITNKTMQNISIIGQNAAEFIKIMPGMAMPGGGQNIASYAASTESTGTGPVGSFAPNGLRTAALDITSDGAHIIDPGCNCGQAVNTNVDMTSELKVSTSNFGAEANKGPVVISAVGKSGGSAFHGEAYLYTRQPTLNANDWSNNAAGVDATTHKMVAPRPESTYWYPGGQIGGPVLIPGTGFNKNKDKLFFFFATEYYKQSIDYGTYKSDVPTAAMRKGDFSDTAYMSHLNGGLLNAPLNTNFGTTGGVIPAAMLASKDGKYGQAMINQYPLPTVNPVGNQGWNYIAAFTRDANMTQIRPRVDYSINDNTKLYVTYNRQRDSQTGTLDTLWVTNAQSWVSPTVPYPSPQKEDTTSDSVTANLTHVFNPTLTNEFVFTYTYLNLPWQFSNRSKVERSTLGLDYKMLFTHANLGTMIQPSQVSWGAGLANMINTGYELNGTVYAKKEMPSFSDNLTKVWGTHTAKFGMYWEHTYNEQPGNGDVNGQITQGDWGGAGVGNVYGDMLIGHFGNGSYDETNYNILPKMRYTSMDFFGQDSWKVTRRLTVEMGLRFQHLGPWVDTENTGFAVWVPSKYSNSISPSQLPGLEWHKIDKSIPVSGTPVRNVFVEPRFGFAWDLFGTGKTVLRGGFGVYRYHDEQNVQNGAFSITQGSFNYSVPAAAFLSQIGSYNPPGGAPPPGSVTTLNPNDDNQPRTRSYSFTVARRLPWSSVLEVAYVGNKADYLSNYNNNIGSINLLPVGALFADKTTNGTPTNFAWTPGFFNNVNANLYRPILDYGTVKVIGHKMYSNYNSLQVSYNKQAGHFTFMTNFTWSKSLGIRGENGATTGDPTTLDHLYGTLPNNRPYIFNAAYVYELPNFAKSNKLLIGLANHWQISGITQIQSGTDIQASISSNLNFQTYYKAGSTYKGYTFPDGTTSMSNTNSLGTPDIGLMPRVICNPTSNLKEHQYINGACFAPPAPGQQGDYVFPYMHGPAFFNSDLSMFKNFTWSENRKIQFRFSAYNFLNHPLWSFTGNSDPAFNLQWNQSGVLNPGFGYATTKYGHRIVQLALKFYF